MANSKHKIIGFDLDGVILDHTENKIKLANQFGWELTPAQTTSGIIKNIMPKSDVHKLQLALYDDPAISLRSPVMKGVKKILLQVKNKYSYFLVSRRKNPEQAIKILQLKGLWPKFFNEVNSFFVLKPIDKNRVGKKLGITHYIDDEPRVLDKLDDIKNKILFDPHNSYPHITDFVRIKSWKEFIDIIDN